MLEKDHDIECWADTSWLWLAVFSFLGIMMSLLFPVGMWWYMRMKWEDQMNQTRGDYVQQRKCGCAKDSHYDYAGATLHHDLVGKGITIDEAFKTLDKIVEEIQTKIDATLSHTTEQMEKQVKTEEPAGGSGGLSSCSSTGSSTTRSGLSESDNRHWIEVRRAWCTQQALKSIKQKYPELDDMREKIESYYKEYLEHVDAFEWIPEGRDAASTEEVRQHKPTTKKFYVVGKEKNKAVAISEFADGRTKFQL